MGRGAWAWLVALGLMGPAGAQEVRGGEDVDETRSADDLPDNMDAFRRTPHTDDLPLSDEEAGTGGAGMAGTEEEEQEPTREEPEAERPEEPRS